MEYEFGHEFTTDQLAAIVPNDLVRYFKKRAYDNPEANTDIEKPQIRADSARYWKKCISHFMHNQHMQWNETHTSRFHGEWDRNQSTFCIPATHVFWTKSGTTPSVLDQLVHEMEMCSWQIRVWDQSLLHLLHVMLWQVESKLQSSLVWCQLLCSCSSLLKSCFSIVNVCVSSN